MMPRSLILNAVSECDRELAALKAAHPDGPPADVYEPASGKWTTVLSRTLALERFGMVTAQQVFPHFFPGPSWGTRS